MAEFQNCIIYLVDSLRFDGYENSPDKNSGLLQKLGVADDLDTPSLNFLSEKGTEIPDPHSPYTSTPPAVGSLLSGLYPREHGMYGFQRPLFSGTTTLPEIFSENGYTTLLFNGIQLFKHNEIADRFDHWLKGPPDRLIKEIQRRNKQGEKVFAYFHTMDVHHPYLLSHYPPDKDFHARAIEKGNQLARKLGYDYQFKPEDAYAESQKEDVPYSCSGQQLLWKFLKTSYHIRIKKEQQIENPLEFTARWYVEGINNFDQNHLERIVDFLNTDKEETLFLLTADHGETIRQANDLLGFEHSFKPNQDLIRVPGILYPGTSNSNIEKWSPTSLVDIAPLIVEKAGLQNNNVKFSGYNLLDEPPDKRHIFSEYSDDIEQEEKNLFPKNAFLKWHCILDNEGYKYTRAGTGLSAEDYSLPAKEFVRRVILKVAFEPPEQQLVERLCEKLGNSPDKKAKQQFVKNIRRQIKG
ncbi:MAG: sulfatase-like hydrolase/transferase, partial [bacterium]